MSLIESVFNHLVLPPKVPGKYEPLYDEVSSDLFVRLLDSIDNLMPHLPTKYRPAVVNLRKSLVASGELNASGCLDRVLLVKAFANIEERPLMLYMEPQNAALIIRVANATR